MNGLSQISQQLAVKDSYEDLYTRALQFVEQQAMTFKTNEKLGPRYEVLLSQFTGKRHLVPRGGVTHAEA